MTERKKYTRLVEIIYEQFYNKEVDGLPVRGLELAVATFSFSDDNESSAFNQAKSELEKIRREGLKMNGTSVVSYIMPSAIKQIGLVNLDKYEKETAAMQAQAASISDSEDSKNADQAEIGILSDSTSS